MDILELHKTVAGAERLCAAFHRSTVDGAAVSWMEGFCPVVAVAAMFIVSLQQALLA